MHIPTKSLKNSFTLPVLGLGTWLMGGKTTHDLHNNDAANITAIQQAIATGVTHIDTAELYAAGYAEILIGQAIKTIDRAQLFITSKVAPEHYHYDDLIASCKASLKRMQIDYLDLYLLHRPILDVPVEEVMHAMDDLKKEGLVKNIGVSNFTVERFQEAQKATKNKIVVNQLHYNLIYREAERKGLVAFCQENDVFLMAWRPLQLGLLTSENNPLMQEMCKKYHKTASQIAIQWLIGQKNVITIAKMESKTHLQENIAACQFTLDAEDRDKLDKSFPNQQDISNAVPLL